eukprot:SAG31_NODE_5427_length_2544_cov_101.590184_2_plen_191_part_00
MCVYTHAAALPAARPAAASRGASLYVRQSNPELFGHVRQFSTASTLSLGTDTDRAKALTSLHGAGQTHSIKHESPGTDHRPLGSTFVQHQQAPPSEWPSNQLHDSESGAQCRPTVSINALSNNHILDWSSREVNTWLTVEELPDVAMRALSSRVDGRTATKMDKADWRELGATGVQASRIIGMVEFRADR